MTDLKKYDFDDLVNSSMAEWNVPGLALSVIEDHQIIEMKGYGFCDMETHMPVSIDTQFLLCSITKSFTAAGLGVLVDDGLLDWDRPVREYLPEFRLHDDASTGSVTVLDLLCHRTGLPRHDWIHAPGDLSTSQIISALRHLEPNCNLRAAYQYQNLGYLVAGHIAERIAGMKWESFLADRLLEPLGFTDFGFSIASLACAPDHACPHVIDGREARRANWAPMRALPAGGLNASVSDMAKWMKFLMSDGRCDGLSILSPGVINQMSIPRVHVGEPMLSEIEDPHYGLGLLLGRYRGEHVWAHTGSWLGWGTIMAMIPERKIGVAVLTNLEPSHAREVLIYSIFDQLCDHPATDWLAHFSAKRQQNFVPERPDTESHQKPRHLNTVPAHAMDRYVGDYENVAYGCISITREDSALMWSWRGMAGRLNHRDDHVFTVPTKILDLNPDGLPLTFYCNQDGVIDRIAAPFEPKVSDIVFRRVYAAR